MWTRAKRVAHSQRIKYWFILKRHGRYTAREQIWMKRARRGSFQVYRIVSLPEIGPRPNISICLRSTWLRGSFRNVQERAARKNNKTKWISGVGFTFITTGRKEEQCFRDSFIKMRLSALHTKALALSYLVECAAHNFITIFFYSVENKYNS